MKGRNRARFEFKAASVNLVLIDARGRGAANFEFFKLIASGPSWSPILLGGRKSGEEVEGRQAMNGRAVKLNRSREASEDPV